MTTTSQRIEPQIIIAGVLVCMTCGNRLPFTSAEANEYIRGDGWPKCCGTVMELIPMRDKSKFASNN